MNRNTGNGGSTITRIQAQAFSGPVPPPSILAQYDAIVPGSANRILLMAEQQSAHREKLESAVVLANIQNQERGARYAFIIALSAIFCGTWILLKGKDAAGLATIITALVGLIGTFVYVRVAQGRERREKQDALTARRDQLSD